MNTEKVTRVEVIDHVTGDSFGRVFTRWNEKMKGKVSVVLQDEGRTLKVFISEHLTEQVNKHDKTI